MIHGSLFSGIGGFDLAAEWAGWENSFHCEWNEFGQRVLKYYWPDAVSYGDITKTDFTVWRGRIDVLTGGFPCQPYSLAGKRKGTDDERHLWPEMLRAIQEIQPRYIVGENVPGLINWNGGLVFEEVQSDLETEGYEVIPFILPAASVNAPHRRDRVWFIAYNTNARNQGLQNGICEFRVASNTQNQRQKSSGQTRQWGAGFENCSCRNNGTASYPDSERQSSKEYWEKKSKWIAKNGISGNWENFPTQSPICNGDDGLSSRLAGITFPKFRNESIKAGGNAIVPQVAYQIFKAINEYKPNFNTNN